MERSATTPGAAGPGTVRLTGGGLAAEDIGRVARGAILELAPEVLERVEASRAVVERALERDVPVYGLNTGLGSRRDRRVPPEDLARYQEQMVWDHAGSRAAAPAPTPMRSTRSSGC
jgi:histidine ammonia-lyase